MSTEKNIKREKENKRKGWVTSVGVHLAILLLFFLFGFKTPYPPPEEEGILIDFGNSSTGIGMIEPKQSEITETAEVEDVVEEQEQVVEEQIPENTEVTEAEIEEAVTQDLEEAIAVTKEEVVEQITEEDEGEDPELVEPVEEVAEDPKPVINSGALYPGNQENSNSTSEGVAGGPGNQGDPSGGESDNYEGTSYGLGDSGIGFSLDGRTGDIPKPVDNSQTEGKVVIKIKVDQFGNVISAEYTSRGSTTTDTHLRNIALASARKAKFNKDMNKPSEQHGTITYTFKVR